MLVEIPELEVILGWILAFIGGLVGLYLFFKIRPLIKFKNDEFDASQAERLEYYERQLIDMKIRLDTLEIQGIEQKEEDPNLELKQFLEKLAKDKVQNKQIVEITKEEEIIPKKVVSTPNIPNIEYASPVDYVLHLITNKAMTSRDIQITLKKSREHTSTPDEESYLKMVMYKEIQSQNHTLTQFLKKEWPKVEANLQTIVQNSGIK